jgi:myo-inositol-1(or 4)-monophosphatase
MLAYPLAGSHDSEAICFVQGDASLDSVDGTANFVHGLPLCGVSLALVESGRPTLGVIALPYLGHRYSAIEGQGAYAGGRKLAVRNNSHLTESIVAIGDYAVGVSAIEGNKPRLRTTELLAARVLRVRMLGSAAIDLAWVASGWLDASIMLSNNPWDTAAGVVIAREAGAQVVDMDGNAHSAESKATIAASPVLLDALLGPLADI